MQSFLLLLVPVLVLGMTGCGEPVRPLPFTNADPVFDTLAVVPSASSRWVGDYLCPNRTVTFQIAMPDSLAGPYLVMPDSLDSPAYFTPADTGTRWVVRGGDTLGEMRFEQPAGDFQYYSFSGLIAGIIPSFSPNGDGAYDQWFVNCPCAAKIRLRISDPHNGYNVVYSEETTDRQLRWDGTESTAGYPLPQGNYHYEVELQRFDGSTAEVSGTVTLIR